MICGGFLRSQSRFARPDYYITSLSICQGVFQKFLSFFQNFFQLSKPLFSNPRRSARLLYHILLRLSRGFSKVFFNFFRDSFSRLSSALALGDRSLTAQLPDSLHIIALLPSFVKRFLTSFFSLGASLVWHKNVVAVLCKLTHKSSVFVPYR